MRSSMLAVLATIATVATASILPFSVHQVVPDDAIGIFRIAGVSGLGCPNRIRHTETVNADGVIPHSAMRHNNGVACEEGSMTIYTTVEDAMNAVEAQGSKDFIMNFASSEEPAVFGIEEQGRTCGGTSFSAGTVVILFTPENTLELSNREAFPAGARYMIIDDPETPGTCTFQSALRPEETEEPVAPTPTPESGDRETPGGVGGGAGAGPEETDDGTGPEETDDGTGSGPGVPPVVGGRPGRGDGGNGNGGDTGGDGTDGDGSGTDGDGEGGETGGVGGAGEETSEPSMSPEPSPVEGEDEEGDDDDDGSVCFPGDADVEIEDGTIKKISDVLVGDRVKVANGMYSDVYMFTHKDANTVHDFVSLSTSSGDKISATRGHYLYINGDFAAAVTAKVGDVLELGNGARTTIEKVAIEKKVGLFNPQTIHGDIIVNSVRASTFTRTIEPQAAQALLAPLRMMYDVVGLSASFLNNGADSIAALLPKGRLSL